MENQAGNSQDENKASGFKFFAAKRILLAAILIIVVVWALGMGLDIFRSSPEPTAKDRLLQHPTADTTTAHTGLQSTAEPTEKHSTAPETQHHPHDATAASHSDSMAAAAAHTDEGDSHTIPSGAESHATTEHESPSPAISHGQAADTQSHAKAADTETHAEKAVHEQPAEATSHGAEPLSHEEHLPRGVAFVEAVIKPLDYELNKRFWGWRPNDIINFTDNTNNFQLGVLEVTRRSTVMLTDRISRTGSTDRLDPYLEDASNWLMVTATRYWFPSPESKYKECLKELEGYKKELIKGNGSFYIRADNLIPLLSSYEDLLGSCDENLVKQKNEDGSDVGFFKADDYFFYAKGVASAMATILEAMHHDFLPTLESRHGTELLHHAVLSCRQAAALSPLFITNTDLDGIFANHRANMAAPISHARYYIGQLIKTLST
jgi:hypothetical protein